MRVRAVRCRARVRCRWRELACVAFRYAEQGQQLAVASGMTGCSRGRPGDFEGYAQYGVHAVEFAVLAQGPGSCSAVALVSASTVQLQSAVECLLVEVCTDRRRAPPRRDLAVSFVNSPWVGTAPPQFLATWTGTLGEVPGCCQVGVMRLMMDSSVRSRPRRYLA